MTFCPGCRGQKKIWGMGMIKRIDCEVCGGVGSIVAELAIDDTIKDDEKTSKDITNIKRDSDSVQACADKSINSNAVIDSLANSTKLVEQDEVKISDMSNSLAKTFAANAERKLQADKLRAEKSRASLVKARAVKAAKAQANVKSER